MIKAIIWDMGNVLLSYKPEVVVEMACKEKEDREILLSELFGKQEWVMGDLGVITPRERFELVRKRVPERLHEALRFCNDNWDICMKPLPHAREYLLKKYHENFPMYVLSNASTEFYRYFPRYYPLSLFKGLVVSCDHHVVKPDRRIYEILCESYGLTPEECLFVDDVKANTEGAASYGLSTLTFTGDYAEVERLVKEK